MLLHNSTRKTSQEDAQNLELWDTAVFIKGETWLRIKNSVSEIEESQKKFHLYLDRCEK